MAFKLCEHFGYNLATIRRRLQILELSERDFALAGRLQQEVIVPRFSQIMNAFMEKMLTQSEVRAFLSDTASQKRVKTTITTFLLSLGSGFDSASYFDDRLNVGMQHEKVGLSLSVYLCAYRMLTQTIIDNFPQKVCADQQYYQRLVAFLYKINALDMSLAIETYHNTHVHSLKESIGDLQARESELKQQAITDSLTGMINHEHVFTELGRVLAAAQREKIPLCVVMADLDHFKKVNDSYGHQAGDAVLEQTSLRIKSSLRDPDLVGRYGGEEFMILLVDSTMDTAGLIAERIRLKIGAVPMKLTDREIIVTVSMGIAAAGDKDTVESLVERADKALYNAKHGGRNQVSIL
ncbi:MAG: diguanylate cyclase [Thiohalomonadales bacterium]